MSEWPHNQLWSENIMFPGHNHTIEIDADSYNQWVRDMKLPLSSDALSDTAFEPGSKKYEVFEALDNKKLIKLMRKTSKYRNAQNVGGGWRFGVRTLPYYSWGSLDWFATGPKRSRLSIYEVDDDCYSKGAAMFTGPVHIPILARGSVPWMSLTPMEIYSLRPALGVAEGHVLVAGLGMGWLTRRLLENSDVTKVTQLELDSDIINFFGKPIKDNSDKKLQLIEADVYQFLKETPQKFDSIIFDIWGKFGEASDDEQFQDIKETDNTVWGWGDADNSCYDYNEVEHEDQAEDEFENDLACWDKEDPQEWWGT